MTWVDSMNLGTLTDEQQKLAARAADALHVGEQDEGDATMLLRVGFSFDSERGGPHALAGPGVARLYWSLVCREFRRLVCTKHRRYTALRREIEAAGSSAGTLIVGAVSAVVASELGTTVGLLTPFCMLCLYCLAKVGKEAFCELGALEEAAQRSRA